MSFKRIWILFLARNREFFRDRASFGWNFLFPFLIVVGFGLIFGSGDKALYKIGVFPVDSSGKIENYAESPYLAPELKKLRYVEFIGFKTKDIGTDKLRHHKVDILLDIGGSSESYWVSSSSPKGYVVEKMIHATKSSVVVQDSMGQKNEITGREISYVDWLFPGIIGMNIMFSALWGVGYIVVRYRKSGVLKRLKATPLTAFEYLSAQMLSRIFLLMFMVVVVWFGSSLILPFHVEGSYASLMLVFFLGGLSLCALGLVIASRGTSEELTSGLINFICWPMMFLSEVWFSIEGAPHWLKVFASLFPLTHMLSAARKIMNDGVGISGVMPEILFMLSITVFCLVMGSVFFKWND